MPPTAVGKKKAHSGVGFEGAKTVCFAGQQDGR